MPARKYLPEDRLRALAEQGLSDREIGQELGCSQSCVAHRRRGLGIPAGRSNGGLDIDLDRVRRLAQTGMSSREIAQEVGCHLGTIEKIRYRNDIPTIRGHGSPGDKNPSWKGGRVVDQDGYVLLHMPDHPDSDSHGRIREHRWVMEQRLGRRLLDTEVVHHVDTNSGNNDPRNLMLFGSNGEHLHYERKGKRPEWSEEGWKRILEAVHRKKGKRQGGDRRAEGRPRGPIGRFVPKGQDSDGQRLP